MGEHSRAVNEGLTRLGPFVLLDRLGMRYRTEGRFARLPCPFHNENTPSAVLRVGAEGTLQLRCHGACQRSWDALALVAHARGLDVEHDHVEVLLESCGLAGLHQIEGEICADEGRERPPPRRYAPPPPSAQPLEPERPREYPPAADVAALWKATARLVDYRQVGAFDHETLIPDAEAYALLAGRRISPEAVTDLDLARVITADTPLPRWASRKGPRPAARSWFDLTYRIVVPTFDAFGAMRGVRAWRVGPPEFKDEPKRLPPAGCRSDGLVLANPVAQAMLREGRAPAWWPKGEPFRVIVCEGEPDHLGWSAHWSDAAADPPAVLGLYSGSWNDAIAARVPGGSVVEVRTDPNEAGNLYAAKVYASLKERCTVLRGEPAVE